MTALLTECRGSMHLITLNRVEKRNAFDDQLLLTLQTAIDAAIADPTVRVIVLKAAGPDFSAGADLAWMQRMAHFNEADNIADARRLARVLYSLHHSPKPTIAMVQGAAFGGGVGLIAACDVAIAAHSARFCFSEIKLGLIPAVISPYVIAAIGARSARALFLTAELFDAARAHALQLVHHVVPDATLLEETLQYAERLAHYAPNAMQAVKTLVQEVADRPIDEALLQRTATLIAHQRASIEGQHGMQAFLNKQTPTWN